MYLSRLYIENYRSIEKLDLSFQKGKNVIVGKNNSGKSNIIKAIDLILGEGSPTWEKSENITENDFFKGDTTKDIFIWCELTRDNDEILDFEEIKNTAFFKIIKNYHDYEISITDFSNKDVIFEFANEECSKLDDKNSGFSKSWIGGKNYCKKTFNDEFRNIHTFSFAFRAKKTSTIIQKELVFLYKEKSKLNWYIGINAKLRNQLIQSAIIPSFRDPKDQLRINSYNWYGKLLKNFVPNNDADLTKAFDDVEKASNKIFDNLQKSIFDNKINIAFPNTKISFQFNPSTKQDTYKSSLIYVDDGFNSELKDKGSGIQSAIVIGLFNFYIRNIAHSNGSLLAIEEPELYLHPQGKRVISDRLSEFLDGGKNQVIITTHSVEFVCCVNENINILVIKKDGNKTIGKNIGLVSPKEKQILIKKQNAEMFFADAVILVEGADKYLFEEISKGYGNKQTVQYCTQNWLNNYNVSIINCSGKKELWKYASVLKRVDIPFFVVSDFDFLRDGLNDYFIKLNFEQEYNTKLNNIKSKISTIITGNYKKINDIPDTDLRKDISSFITILKEKGLFILSGELEDYYKIKPTYDKEYGVIETIGKTIEECKEISEYVDIAEFEEMFKCFASYCLHINLQ